MIFLSIKTKSIACSGGSWPKMLEGAK